MSAGFGPPRSSRGGQRRVGTLPEEVGQLRAPVAHHRCLERDAQRAAAELVTEVDRGGNVLHDAHGHGPLAAKGDRDYASRLALPAAGGHEIGTGDCREKWT